LPREAIVETEVEEVVLLDITGVSDEEFEANWQMYYDDVKEHGWRSDYYIGEGGQTHEGRPAGSPYSTIR